MAGPQPGLGAADRGRPAQGQHEQALEHLQAALQLAPEAALPRLLLGAAHLGHAMSRKVAYRNMTVLTAFAYLQVCLAPASRLLCHVHTRPVSHRSSGRPGSSAATRLASQQHHAGQTCARMR